MVSYLILYNYLKGNPKNGLALFNSWPDHVDYVFTF